MTRFGVRFATAVSVLIFPTYVYSADGVLEINQACALNGGCFSGDIAGFPVTIDASAGRSYRLTGDLDLSAHPTDPAILISASFVTLDLNGFQIAGATDCEPEPIINSELICTPSNAGAHGIGVVGEIRSVSIKNGTIRKMPDDGISGALALRTRVVNVTLSENAGWGALLGDRSLIQSSDAEMNGGGGFSVQDDSNVSHSQANGNDGNAFDAGNRAIVSFCAGEEAFLDNRAFELGPSSKFKSNTVRGSARCGGGICRENRRFYLTIDFFLGGEALSACAEGFHMAALFEIVDPSKLSYDFELGLTAADSGSGPPTADIGGFIRTGYSSVGGTTAALGRLNCQSWTSSADVDEGTQVGLTALWEETTEISDLWFTSGRRCDFGARVWCVEH